MKNYSSVLALLVGLVVMTTITNCYYDEYQPEPIIVDPPEEPISFSTEIVPIFEATCMGIGCHGNNGVAPILTSSKAYESLISGNYINTDDPLASDLYLWINGDERLPMPLTGRDPELVELVLGWMYQGALDN